MTEDFLRLKSPKMLMLADRNQMDSLLIRTHMEGKYMLGSLYHAGHHMHEDQPKEFA